MPSHYGNGMMKKEKDKNAPKKGALISELLKEASKHHSKKHMELMKDFIKVMPKDVKPLMKFNIAHKLSKKYIPNFNSLPVGGITFNPLNGKAYRREKDDTFTELDPINLKPLKKKIMNF